MILDELVRQKLQRDGISQREAARQVGVSPTTIGRILNGENVDHPTIEVMCRWLGVSVSSVLDSSIPDTADGLAASVAALVQQYPDLAEVFESALKKIQDGEVDPSVIKDIVLYANYRISQS